jgi:hypothetical protein
MNEASYTTTFTVDQSPAEAFAAINNVRGWWSGEIDGRTDELGAQFTYRHLDIHRSKQEITELIPGQRVAWHVLDGYLSFTQDTTEWTGTDITFDLVARGSGTEVRFTHAGLSPAGRVLRHLLKRLELLHRHQPAEPDRHGRGPAQREGARQPVRTAAGAPGRLRRPAAGLCGRLPPLRYLWP